MKRNMFAAAMLVAGIALTGSVASAQKGGAKPVLASIVCMNLAKANATVTSDHRTVHYTVNAGGNPSEIELQFTGADRVYLDLSGRLVLLMKNGAFRTYVAKFYQNVDGKEKLVSGNFRVIGANHVAFQVGKYNAAIPLEIETSIHGDSDIRG